MRLFIAIPLPDRVKKQLQSLEKSIKGVRWQDSTQLHLTLRFIGPVNEATSEKVKNRLDNINHDSFEIAVNGLGQFPEEGKARVLWAAVEKKPELMQLQEKVEEACVKSGLEAESRDYKPHITLAKVKDKRSHREVRSLINDHSQFRIESIPVNDFILYHSKLTEEGAIHTEIDKYELN